jgi:hypothetical protein
MPTISWWASKAARKPNVFSESFGNGVGSGGATAVSSYGAKRRVKRMVAKLRGLKAELTRRMHEPTAQVGEWLKRAVQGYYQYHAVQGNLKQLGAFRHRLRLWRRNSESSQSTGREALAAVHCAAGALDSVPASSAPLSSSAVRRQTSKIKAVWRSEASRWSSG